MRGIVVTVGCSYATALFACTPPSNQEPLSEGGRVEVVGMSDKLTSSEWSEYVANQDYIHRLAKPGTRVRLNFADPRQYNFARSRLKLVGKTAENSPYLFEIIEARRERHLASNLKPGVFAHDGQAHSVASAAQEMHFIESADVQSMTNLKAAASSTYPNGSFATGLDVNASTVTGVSISPFNYVEEYDNPNGNVGANVSIDAIGNPSQTNIKTWKVSSYKWEDSDSGFADSYVYTTVGSKNQLVMGTVPEISAVLLDAPRGDVKPPNDTIHICVMRPWHTDCDYVLPADPATQYWVLKVPLKGSVSLISNHTFDVTTINNEIKAKLAAGIVPPRDVGDLKLILAVKGGGCDATNFTLTGLNMNQFWKTVNVTATTFSWDLTDTNSAYFAQGCQQYQNSVIFTARIPLPTLEAGKPSFDASMTISNDINAHPDKTLEKMIVTNSCLAEGTQIQLGNGKLAPIETLRIGHEVFNPYDRKDHALTITDTAKGSEHEPMVRIRDEGGRTLLMTEMHPIATPDRGMVQARYLRTGDVVMTKKGPSKLTEVSREPYMGQVYNLKVGSEAELASLGPDQTVVYANNFVVGDGQIQSKYEELALKRENSRTAEQIPAQWRRDYQLSPHRK